MSGKRILFCKRKWAAISEPVLDYESSNPSPSASCNWIATESHRTNTSDHTIQKNEYETWYIENPAYLSNPHNKVFRLLGVVFVLEIRLWDYLFISWLNIKLDAFP